jgi:hypothetical protein
MISVIAGTVPPAEPLNDPAITRPGGWILGRRHTLAQWFWGTIVREKLTGEQAEQRKDASGGARSVDA